MACTQTNTKNRKSKNAEQQDVTDIQNKLCLRFSLFVFIIYIS